MALSKEAFDRSAVMADEDEDDEPRIISDDDGFDGSIGMVDEDEDSDEPRKKRAVNGKGKKRKPPKADIWTHFTTDESGNYAECTIASVS